MAALVPVTVRLPADLMEDITAAAKQQGGSRHRLLQLVLIDALSDLGIVPAAEAR